MVALGDFDLTGFWAILSGFWAILSGFWACRSRKPSAGLPAPPHLATCLRGELAEESARCCRSRLPRRRARASRRRTASGSRQALERCSSSIPLDLTHLEIG